MPNSWGRQPRYDIFHDLQFLALWIFIIGVVGYLLFPGFFSDVYDRLTEPTYQDIPINESYSLPATSLDGSSYPTMPSPEIPNIYNSLYNNKSEIATGYWAIFVNEGEFQQLSLGTEAYSFLIRLIENDKIANEGKILILTENGQIRKYDVSLEIYDIVVNLALIETRAKS